MSDVLTEYQKWKQQGENLRTQAKQAMETRFRELLSEAVRIGEDYRQDFGALPKLPPSVTTFRFKSGAKPKAKKAAAAPAAAAAKPEPKSSKPDPKVDRLTKRLAAARKKLEEAKASGAATRTLEDRVYEIEDELRLAASA